MLATKINLSQMVDLAVGTPEVGAVNCNVLHTLLHAILSQLNIVDVQADINDFVACLTTFLHWVFPRI
jgi:hypothetical protein